MVNMESSPLLSICEDESRRVLQVPLAGSNHRVPPFPPSSPAWRSPSWLVRRRVGRLSATALSRTGTLYLVLSVEAPLGFQLVRHLGLAAGDVARDGCGVDKSGHQRAQDDSRVDDAAGLHLCGSPRVSHQQLCPFSSCQELCG